MAHKHHHHDDFNTHDVVASAAAYLGHLSDTIDFSGDEDDCLNSECQRSLNYILGSLDAIHILLDLGVILSPDMEDFINFNLHAAAEWCEEHNLSPQEVR